MLLPILHLHSSLFSFSFPTLTLSSFPCPSFYCSSSTNVSSPSLLSSSAILPRSSCLPSLLLPSLSTYLPPIFPSFPISPHYSSIHSTNHSSSPSHPHHHSHPIPSPSPSLQSHPYYPIPTNRALDRTPGSSFRPPLGPSGAIVSPNRAGASPRRCLLYS